MSRFLDVISIKIIGNAIERCAMSGPQKRLTKESDRLYNHSTLLTMPHVGASLEKEWVEHELFGTKSQIRNT